MEVVLVNSRKSTCFQQKLARVLQPTKPSPPNIPEGHLSPPGLPAAQCVVSPNSFPGLAETHVISAFHVFLASFRVDG